MAESATKDEKFVKRIDFSSANVASSWKIFKSQFKIYKVAKKFADMTEEQQICNMLVQMGPDSVQIYEQFTYNDAVAATKRTLENTMTFFDTYFEPVKNVIFERSKFNSMTQGDSSIHQFIVNLQQQAAYCDYAAVKDELVRDRIVVGVKDQKLREYLIDLEDLDLAKCIQKSKQFTANHGQASKFQEVSRDNVDTVFQRKTERPDKPGVKKQESGSRDSFPSASRDSFPSAANPCYWCAKPFHKGRRCPAKESVCMACKGKGHWAKSKACKGRKQAQAHEVSSYGEDDMEGLFLDSDQL